MLKLFISTKLWLVRASAGKMFTFLCISLLATSGCTLYLPVIAPGSYISEAEGPLFQETPLLDERNAMVYIYRPNSEWADDELEAPSFYLGEDRLFGLKSGQYIWLEMYAGGEELVVKRSFLGLNIKDITALKLDLKAGEVRYFRYSEDNVIEDESAPNSAVSFPPIQEVSAQAALPEISQMRLTEPGALLSCNAEEDPWFTFKLPPRAGKADRCEIPQPTFKPVRKRRVK